MKKFIMGLVVGAVLMMTGQLYAASPLLGKKVESSVSVILNGKSIGSGIVVDSKTYLPVRTISDAMGMKTTYKSGVVTVTGEENAQQAAEQQAEVEANTNQFNTLNAAYFELLTKVDSLQTLVKGYEEKLIPEWEAKVSNQPKNPVNTATLDRYKTQLQQKRDELTDAQTKLQAAKTAVEAYVKDHPEYEKFIAKLPQ
ncbi:hypothetical protein [Paenibacillus sp. RUD330]|uniref:hypothetical protein n=1 Tax=Paenibacillus sp. RUD330 TaxID=2023772 RepID=UPI000B92D90B|nr:hypothetical protein [Paenibacillus sp. RUD330]ASS66209.1 hypothetical protein CIC07_08655 [Paenibacillus sp. RUD330]